MGTILQSISTRVSGLLLLESFESLNFMLDQAWTLLHGTPTITDSVAKEGLFSLVMDTTYPQISKKFAAPFCYSTVWFYDDATQTASTFKPQVNWSSSAGGQSFTFGVNNSISTTHYVFSEPGSGGDTATAIARSTGWHRFTIYQRTQFTQVITMIDNVVNDSVTYTGTLDTITLGALNFTDTPFGFFDWVQVMLAPYITMYGLDAGQYLNVVLDSAGAIIKSSAQASAGIAQVDVSTVDFPTQGFLQVQQPPYGDVLFYQSDMLNLDAGNVYLLNLFRFGRRPTTLSDQPMATRNDVKAVGGPKQSTFFYDQDQVTLSFRALTESQKNDLLRWWITVKRGEIFSVAVEENDIFLDYTQAAVTAYPTGQLVLSAPGTSQGQALTVQSSDGEIKENVTVSAVSFNDVTGYYTASLAAPQAEAVAANLQVKALYYWPFACATGKSLPQTLEDPRSKRWTVQITFEELIQSPDWIQFLMKL